MNRKNVTSLFGFVALALSTSLSSVASAQQPPRYPSDFGAKGQISVNVDLPLTNDAPQLAILNTSYTMGQDSTTTVVIAPALDYFVAPNISIGGQLGYRHDSQTPAGSAISFTGTGFIIGVRGGINIPLGSTLSFWPRLSLTYSSWTGGGYTDSAVPLAIFAPLLWHPASHFFIGGGPVFATELSHQSEAAGVSYAQPKRTDIGLQAIVGGYFGP